MRYTLLICSFLLSSFIALSQSNKGLSIQKVSENNLNGKTYALIVGVSKYRNPAIPSLQYADKDAIVFRNYLVASGVDSNNIVLLLNENAKYSEIILSLYELIEKTAKGDKVFFYFSGHGDVESKLVTNDGYLLPYDAPNFAYATSAINVNMLQGFFSTLSAHGVLAIVITDACHAGNLAGGPDGLKNISNVLKTQWKDEIKILSCQPGEVSLEGKQWGSGRGLFSYELINGMAGAADKNNDNIVTLQELNRFMTNTVPDEANPNDQNPILSGDMATIISSVNKNYLKQYTSNNNTSMIATVDMKGFDEVIIKKLPDSIQHFYADFKMLLDKGDQFLLEDGFTAEGLKKIPDSLKHFYNDNLQRNHTQYDFIVMLDSMTGDEIKERKITAYDYLQKIPGSEENKTLLGIMKRNYAVKKIDEINSYLGKMLEVNYFKSDDFYRTFAINQLELYDLETLINILGSEKLNKIGVLSKVYFIKTCLSMDTTKYSLNLLDSVIQLDPLFSYAFQLKADKYFNFKLYDSAIKYADMALRISPNIRYCNKILGASFRAKGQFDSSVFYYKKLLNMVTQINQKDAYDYYKSIDGGLSEKLKHENRKYLICYPIAQLYTTYIMQKKSDSSRKYYDSYLNYDYPYLDTISLKSDLFDYVTDAYIEMGNYKNALDYALRAEKIRKNETREYYIICYYSQMGDIFNALQSLEHSFKMGAHDSISIMHDDRLIALRAQPEFKTMIKKYFPDDNDSTNAIYFIKKAKYYRDNEKNYVEAQKIFKKAISIDSSQFRAYIGLSKTYALTGDIKNSIVYLEIGLGQGWDNFPGINQDLGFDNIRFTPEYKALMKKYFPLEYKE